MPDLFRLGMNAKIYRGATSALLSALTEMSNVKDVKLNLSAGEADVTTRANSGWKGTAPTLREASVEFQMVFKTEDTHFTAIKNAFLANGTVELAVLTGVKDAVGTEGLKGSFSITNFSRNEQLTEAITYDVTAKLAAYDQWVEVSGS